MAIETTEFANVSIGVSPVGVSSGNFGILGFLTDQTDIATNPITVAERGRAYTSLASVTADWPTTTEVYKAAAAFYGQTPTPKDFVVLMQYKAAQSAVCLGAPITSTPAQLAAKPWASGTGGISMTIDALTVNITTLNIAAQTTYAGIAAVIQTAIRVTAPTATCVWTGTQFKITSGTTGALSLITAATGSATADLGLQAHQASIAAGVAIETAVQALSRAVFRGIDFTAFDMHRFNRDITVGSVGNNTVDVAAWAEGEKKIFCNTTNDLSCLSAAIFTDTPSLLKILAYRYTMSTFSKNPAQYPSSAVFGRAASVNFSAANTTLTLNLKAIAGVAAENLTPSEYATLKFKYCSAVVQIGKSTSAFTDSRMASGSWLDTTHGLLWLENRCEVDLFNLLYQSTTKIPFTQVGINTVAATLERSLQAAVRNGLAAPGYLADGTFLPEGFLVTALPLADVPSGDLGNRLYSGMSFVIKGAGALHDVEVSGSFTE